MRALLDTHTFIWFAEGSTQLSETAHRIIEDVENELVLSVASLWEMAIKISLGRLRFDTPFEVWISVHLERLEIGVLAVELAHLAAVATLPMHHRDPFDRMIIAQAILILPIMVGLTISALKGVDSTILDTLRSLGATRYQFMNSVVREARYAIMAAVVLGFGRAISEVGAAIMIGGNIRGHTRVLTTAISLETSMGNLAMSIALGIILLGIALVINLMLAFVQNR